MPNGIAIEMNDGIERNNLASKHGTPRRRLTQGVTAANVSAQVSYLRAIAVASMLVQPV